MKFPLAFLALLPSLLFAASPIWNGTVNTAWYKASETEFTITTAEQLAGLAQLVNSGTSMEGKTIKLGDDIVLNNTAGWENWASNNSGLRQWMPIGIHTTATATARPFSGTFNGDGYTVSGVYINGGYSQGLFGFSQGTIKNLGVVASYINGGERASGLVGTNEGSISNSYATGNVSGCGNNTYASGLVGINRGTISNSYATGNVSGCGNWVGGLVGSNAGSISNSYATGNVSGRLAGGLVGVNTSTISNSYATGNVEGNYSLVGTTCNGACGTISNSYYNSDSTTGSTGIGLTTDEMKNISTYIIRSNWDFESIWAIDPALNGGYPFLLSQSPSYIQNKNLITASKFYLANQCQKNDTIPTTIEIHTGSPITPQVDSVVFGTIKLDPRTDYDVLYYNNTEIGTAKIIIQGKGNSYGAKVLDFYITDFRNIANATVSSIPDQLETGSPITYKPVVKDYSGAVTLREGTDYILGYSSNISAGQAIITIIGRGVYDGSSRTVPFYIVGAKRLPGNTAVSIVDSTRYVYSGDKITPEVTVTYTLENITLVKDQDYTVSYGDNTNATSPGAIYINGIGNYIGAITKNFPIAAKALATSMIAPVPPQQYEGEAVKPEVTLTDGDKTLALGTDYTVNYLSNEYPNEEAIIMITGTGNYSGTITAYFAITEEEIEKTPVAVTWLGPFDFEYNGQNRCPSATATLPNGGYIALSISCTEVKNARTEPYVATATYPNALYELLNNTIQFTISPAPITVALEIPNINRGATLRPSVKGYKENPSINYWYSSIRDSSYTQTAPTNEGVYYAYAIVSPTNNYYGSTTDTVSFSIYESNPTPIPVIWNEHNIFVYTGEEQKPGASAPPVGGISFPLLVNGAIDAGPQTATARFQDERTDYRLTNETKAFTIAPKPLDRDNAIEPIGNFFFTGSQIRPPKITVKDGNKELDEGIDYTVSYGANISELGTVIVTGKGNYTDTASRHFPIISENAAVVSVVWDTERTFAYDGTEHAPTATTASNLELEVIGKQSNAGSHTAVAQLKTPNPNIMLTNASMPYTITKKQLTVSWTPEREFVYNKMVQVPTPSVDEPGVELRVSNAYSEAGEYTAANMLAPYALIISSNADNYELLNNSVDYSITKKPLEAVIDGADEIFLDVDYLDNTESIKAYLLELLAYSGFATNTETGETDNSSVLTGSPSISVSESGELDTLENGLVRKLYSASIDASTVSAKNYTPKGNVYLIPVSSAALVPVIWGSTVSFVYDGAEHAPTAAAEGFELEVTGKQSNAGGYTATARLKTPNERVFLQNENMPYTITKKPLEVSWEAEKEYVYNKMTQGPAPSVDEPGVELRVSNTYSGVGKYTAENKRAPYAVIISPNADNYELRNNSADYEILPKPLKPYFAAMLPAFEYNTDTLWVPSEVFSDTNALQKILEQVIAYDGFATDSEGNSDDDSVLKGGKPQVSIEYAAPRPMLSKRVETTQKATATIVTDNVSADNYVLTRPAIVIMETIEDEEEAEKINCYRVSHCTELSKEVCDFIDGEEVESCSGLRKSCAIEDRCVDNMLIGECTGIGGETLETTCAEVPLLRPRLSGGSFRVWQTASGVVNVDLGYMPTTPAKLQIYDLKGNLVATEQVNTRFANVRVGVPSGVYLFRAGGRVILQNFIATQR